MQANSDKRSVRPPTGGGAAVPHTKVCPRCGSTLFEDMDVCYGCLYDFRAPAGSSGADVLPQGPAWSETAPGAAAAGAAVADEVPDEVLWSPLDEPEEDPGAAVLSAAPASVAVAAPEPEPARPGEPPATTAPVPAPPCPAVASMAGPARAAAASKPSAAPERPMPAAPGTDAVDFAALGAQDTRDLSLLAQKNATYVVRVEQGTMAVTFPLADKSIAVGRSPACDVVLANLAVSRLHMCLELREGEVFVLDGGAANPAVVDGAPLSGERPWLPGTPLNICGANFSLIRLDPR